MALGKDLRERIVKAVEEGQSRRAVAKRFQVNRNTVNEYVKRHSSDQGLKPKSPPGGRPKIDASREAQLRSQVKEYPDATLEEHAKLWYQKTGVQVSFSCIDRALRRMGITRKKNSMRHGT